VVLMSQPHDSVGVEEGGEMCLKHRQCKKNCLEIREVLLASQNCRLGPVEISFYVCECELTERHSYIFILTVAFFFLKFVKPS
uniref:Uncharacterized protein n=1 Tax=Seriola lalandi dorsalis TaxID=1841481 RepID=A0A3B4YM24_SERLL